MFSRVSDGKVIDRKESDGKVGITLVCDGRVTERDESDERVSFVESII